MKTYKLSELLSIQNGKDYKLLKTGEIPVYGSGGIMTYVDEYVMNGESILLPRKGTLDNILYVNGKFWTVDTMYWTKINTSLAYPKYLYCYLSQLDLSCRDSGSTLPSMTFDSYYSLDINLPSIEAQVTIGDAIFKIIEKISLNNSICSDLESMAKLLYDYWFVQFDFPDENGKPYKSSGGKMVWNEELKREIPEGWNNTTLKRYIGRITNGLNPRKNFILGSGNNYYITIKSLTGTDIDWTACDKCDDAALKKINSRSQLQIGDVIFSAIGTIGRSYYIQDNPYNWNISETSFTLRPNKDIPADFFYSLMCSDEIQKQADMKAMGSTMRCLVMNTLCNIPYVDIPVAYMKKYSLFSAAIYKKMNNIHKENQQLSSLRDFLLPMLMNGQVKVAENDN